MSETEYEKHDEEIATNSHSTALKVVYWGGKETWYESYAFGRFADLYLWTHELSSNGSETAGSASAPASPISITAPASGLKTRVHKEYPSGVHNEHPTHISQVLSRQKVREGVRGGEGERMGGGGAQLYVPGIATFHDVFIYRIGDVQTADKVCVCVCVCVCVLPNCLALAHHTSNIHAHARTHTNAPYLHETERGRQRERSHT